MHRLSKLQFYSILGSFGCALYREDGCINMVKIKIGIMGVALAACLQFTGCLATEEAPIESKAPTIENTNSITQITSSPAQSSGNQISSNGQNEYSTSKESTEVVTEENITSTENSAETVSTQPSTEKDESEIILCEISGNPYRTYSIIGVNPDDGKRRTISTFSVEGSITSSDGSKWRLYPLYFFNYSKAPQKYSFSSDYKYIAVTRESYENGELHAGFYDENEIFTDITELAGFVRGDFDKPVRQLAIGFTDDGQFVFADTVELNQVDDIKSWTFYQVQVSNNLDTIKTSLQQFNYVDDFLKYGEKWELPTTCCAISDVIDNDTFIIDYHDEFVNGYAFDAKREIRIYDKISGNTRTLLSSDVRENWSGVINPSGDSIAFLSIPRSGNGSASIYTIPLNGGEPQKVCENIPGADNKVDPVTRPQMWFILSSFSHAPILLDWK